MEASVGWQHSEIRCLTDASSTWLERCSEEYRSRKNDMHETIEDFHDNMDKFGLGLSSSNPLEQIDTGDGSIPRSTFMDADQKSKGKLNRCFTSAKTWSRIHLGGRTNGGFL
jgi:hypothetical protein